MEKITSRSNSLIKHIKKLFTSRRARTENAQFALEGARLCFDALNSDCQPLVLLLTEAAYEKYEDKCRALVPSFQNAYFISEDISAYLGDTKTPQGVFAICSQRKKDFSPQKGKKYIALDQIQDPSNLGAVIRSAEALGIDGALLCGCCDIYNPKVLRASMGGVLRFPVMICSDLAAEITGLKSDGFSTSAAVPDSNATDIKTVGFSGSDVCVIGNEGNGVSNAVKNACDQLVTINMLGRAESLNASAAAAIVMWEMLR